MTRVAGIIVNLVPYHHTRWEAFARSAGAECHLVELTDQDAFKVLEFSAAASYQRQTLFPHNASETICVRDLRKVLAARLNTLRPDVVCVSGWGLPVSLAALDWAARNHVPVVMLSESNEFDEPRKLMKEWIKRRIVGLCSAGFAGGTPQADYLVKLGLSRDSVFQGYDAVDNDYFAQGAKEIRSGSQEMRNKHGMPKKYFLACCRFGQKKNVPRLVEAYGRYRERTQKLEASSRNSEVWDLVLLGDGELRPQIEAVIGQCGVTESVHLVGAKPYGDLPVFYGLAGAFIHASTTEQWGLVVNEAMASGLPVLVSNRCGCARDLVQDGVNGFTFDPYDVEEMAELMLKISSFKASSSPPQPGRGIEGEVSNESLAAFGAASQRIIADWGPERFATGLKAAVDHTLKIGPKKASWLDHLLLRLLLSR